MPEGETSDHPLANPFAGTSPRLEPLKLSPILVVVGGNELLKDRVEEYAQRLKEMGKAVEYVEFGGKEHGFFTYDPFSEAAYPVLRLIQRFIAQNS